MTLFISSATTEVQQKVNLHKYLVGTGKPVPNQLISAVLALLRDVVSWRPNGDDEVAITFLDKRPIIQFLRNYCGEGVDARRDLTDANFREAAQCSPKGLITSTQDD